MTTEPSEDKHRIAILDDYQNAAVAFADWSALPEVEVVPFREHVADEDRLVERLAGYDMLYAMRERTPITRSLLERLPDLKLIATAGAFNRAIDVAAARDLGVVVCGSGGVRHTTSEFAWAMIMALTRRIPWEDASIRAGGWQTGVGIGLRGRKLGIVGLGHIGADIAGFAHAFGMEVVAWSENLTDERAAECGVTKVEFDELLSECEIVTIHTVLSDRTEGLIGERELRLMRPDAYLVNTSRGPIVDEEALARALCAGEIAGAGVDAFTVEPLPESHPLRDAPNTILTPHIGYVSAECYEPFFQDVVEGIRAFLAGEPLKELEPAPGEDS